MMFVMNKIKFINMCIVEFGKKYNMSAKIAFNYLRMYKGMEFLNNCYEAEHQLSLRNSLNDLAIICKRNGGTL